MQHNTRYFELTASTYKWHLSKEKTITAWGFNNTLPGPVLRVKKGDTVVVKVKNNLPEPTMIHWHGVRLPSSMDGTHDSQAPIQPGEEFEYSFTVPDAGTFWYHSHYNETFQMERGMYGALIVEDDEDPIFDNDRVFMLDDMKLNKNNEFSQGNRISRWMERHDGREGSTILVNGKENPLIEMNAGQTDRWRFINASSARYVRLHLQGKRFRIIGTDGGLIERPLETTEVMLTSGERVDIAIGSFKPGEEFTIESLPYNRVTFVKNKHTVFANVKVAALKSTKAVLPNELRKIKQLANPNAIVNRKISMSVAPSLKRGIDFLVNNQLHHHDHPVRVGELQVWEIANKSLMDHPFHLHGFFFQVLTINDKPVETLAWKDTVNIPPRTRVKIAWMPDNRPGKWMYHCHILEHHEAGMMSHFAVA